jgi:hypothetical protein
MCGPRKEAKNQRRKGHVKPADKGAPVAAAGPGQKRTTDRSRDDSRAPADHRAALEALVERANRADTGALAELRAYLDRHPEIWQTCGDLSKCAERAWLELLSGEALAAESIKRHIEQLRADLAGSHPTAMELLLVNRAVMCYLAVQHAELVSARTDTASTAQSALRLKRCESAQRRLLAALRMLALLRGTVPQGMAPLNPLRLHAGDREQA